MSKIKKSLKFLLNPWWGILFFLVIFWMIIFWPLAKPIKKLIMNTFVSKQETKTDSSKKIKQKISLNEGDYFSTNYSVNTNDNEKIITTAGVIYVLGNGNVIHVIASGENIDGRIKETEETVDFIIKHEDEILDDIARAIVEAEQKSPPLEPEKEKPSQKKVDAPVKKKV